MRELAAETGSSWARARRALLRQGSASLRLSLALACVAVSGCAGHAARTLAARSALDAGNPAQALKDLNQELEVASEKDLPQKVAGDNSLLLLDRAMVLQQLAQYTLSSRDLEVSDKQIEILDLSHTAAADIGRYLFSDNVGPYKAPPYEKLMINSMNMVNYLVRADLNGGRIEARRLAVMQKFMRDSGDAGRGLLGPGSYLAGFVFEKSGEADEALRYYDEALEYGSYHTLDEPVRRLSKRSSVRSPRIRAILQRALEGAPTLEDDSAAKPAAAADVGANDCELLVILNFGRVPAKYAKRIPIGLALTYASGALSPNDQAQANRLALQGLVSWVNYPELGEARGTYDRPEFGVDGAWRTLEGVLAVDREAKQAWESGRGAVIASAITRLIARIVAGETTNKVAGGGLLGAVLSLGTQATLTATDTPDTRSWATLPARIAFGRMRLEPGEHTVDLSVGGQRKRQKITLSPGGWAVVNLTVLE